MTTTETTMTVRQIKAAFDALSGVFYSENRNHAKCLLAQCREEEREHRGFMGGFSRCHTADTIGVADAARLFAVKRVAEYLRRERYPTGKDYLHTQTSCFYAAGIAATHKPAPYGAHNEKGDYEQDDNETSGAERPAMRRAAIRKRALRGAVLPGMGYRALTPRLYSKRGGSTWLGD